MLLWHKFPHPDCAFCNHAWLQTEDTSRLIWKNYMAAGQDSGCGACAAEDAQRFPDTPEREQRVSSLGDSHGPGPRFADKNDRAQTFVRHGCCLSLP